MDRARKQSGLLSWRTLITLACLALVLGLGFATVGGYWGRNDWRLDGLSHFRVQYFLCLALLGAFTLMTRRWKLCVLSLVLMGWNAFEVFHWPQKPSASDGPVYKAASLNIHTSNRDFDAVYNWVQRQQPDIFVIVEAINAMQPLYDKLDTLYPYCRFGSTAHGGFGAMIYSRFPITRETYPWAGTGSLVAGVTFPEGAVTVVAMHPLSPGNKDAWRWRNSSLMDLAKFCAEQPGPLLVMGDMNSTPWSFIYKDFVRTSGLHEPVLRFKPHRTWPVGMPWAWIPIDHMFVSDAIEPTAYWVGQNVGSDHYPVLMTFRLEPQAQAAAGNGEPSAPPRN